MKKKKVRCKCKKKCRGICKRAKNLEDKQKAEEEAARLAAIEKPVEKAVDEIPSFPGRKLEDGEGFIRDIKIEHMSIAIGSIYLLENTNFNLNWGNRYGLIGSNGCGKSTLMQKIAHREVNYQANLMVHMVHEEVPASDTTALNCVMEADTERTALMKLHDE